MNSTPRGRLWRGWCHAPAAPRVLLREEYWQYGTPYPLNGTADFYDYENAGESFDYMMKSGLFDAPAACAR